MRYCPVEQSRTVLFSALLILLTLATTARATDNSVKFDFDGDGKTDLAVYRPGVWTATERTSGTFYYLSSSTNAIVPFAWGLGGDRPAVSDYDADGKADFAIHRSWDDGLKFPWDASDYWIYLSGSGSWYTRYFLGHGPIMSRNFFGGAEAEIAVNTLRTFDQDPNEHCFISQLFISVDGNYFSKDLTDQCATATVQRTLALGDYNGDGYSDLAAFVKDLTAPGSDGRFEVWLSPLAPGLTAPDIIRTANIEFPIPGDYDGDLRTDFGGGYYRDGRLYWRLHYSYSGQTIEYPFGLSGDKPVPGDYDGDGRTDPAVYRPSSGTWYVWKTSDATWYVERLGVATDIPIPLPNAY
jgi:hypothetical protein